MKSDSVIFDKKDAYPLTLFKYIPSKLPFKPFVKFFIKKDKILNTKKLHIDPDIIIKEFFNKFKAFIKEGNKQNSIMQDLFAKSYNILKSHNLRLKSAVKCEIKFKPKVKSKFNFKPEFNFKVKRIINFKSKFLNVSTLKKKKIAKYKFVKKNDLFFYLIESLINQYAFTVKNLNEKLNINIDGDLTELKSIIKNNYVLLKNFSKKQ